MTPKQAEAIAALDNEIIKKAIRNAFDSGHAAGIREAYEDAARIAEEYAYDRGWSRKYIEAIAAAIRARASEQ
jgi:DNA-binding IclR family transcriptional regulator